jgi:hypothetical protein
MTHQDPKLPDPGLGRNPPRYRDSSFGPGSFVATVLGTVLIVGLIAYAISGPSGTTASNPPPVTTGQGSAQVSPPAGPRTNSAPTATPNPGMTTGQDARPDAAPPAPKEPQ